MENNDKDKKLQEQRKRKPTLMLKELCGGIPMSLLDYTGNVGALEFEGKPDYDYLVCLFKVDMQQVARRRRGHEDMLDGM